ncbi:SCO3374 family protein [Streptomyces sp. NPDC005648]|uniref:SCO3374 family protein n=1 Tax=Streptomyces sp. NPDC005648 TaxID=3157044 RepID=UPI0033B349B1
MVGSHHPKTLPPASTDLTTVPLPRRPLDPDDRSGDHLRRWYENELGWPTVPEDPHRPHPGVRLRVGERFDVLDVPAEAGRAALRRLAPGAPVALRGERMRLLMAAGSAEELPGLLDWLEWGALALDLVTIGEGGVMDAPLLPQEAARVLRPPGPAGARPLPLPDLGGTLQGAAVWLRPPEPGREVEASLPTLSALGGGGCAPDLVRLVHTVATQCHRLRLRRACAEPSALARAGDQAFAFS